MDPTTDIMYEEEVSPEGQPEDSGGENAADEPKTEPETTPVDPETSLQQMRSSWKFASIIQFCRMFSAPLNLKPFSADMLEGALMNPGDHLVFISELVYKLVRRDAVRDYREGDSDFWEDVLHKKFARQWRQILDHNPFRTKTFMDLPPMTRVSVLYGLCDWRAHECRVVKDTMRVAIESPEYTADALRHYPLGEDSKGSRYYYFASNYEDCRLYREDPPKLVPLNKKKLTKEETDQQEQEEAGWFTHCITLEDVEQFVESLAGSRNKQEKRLHDILASQIVPKLIETAASRKKAEERAAALEAMPKRSDRLQEAAKRKEQEERLRQMQEAEIKFQRETRSRLKSASLNPFLNSGHLSREERFRLRQERLGTGDEYGNGYYSSDMDEPRKRRKYQHGPGWSPLVPPYDILVFRRPRTGAGKQKTNLEPIVAEIQSMRAHYAQTTAGQHSDYDEFEADEESEEEEEWSEEAPVQNTRSRKARKQSDGDTPATIARLRATASRGRYADYVVAVSDEDEDEYADAADPKQVSDLELSEAESDESPQRRHHRDRSSRARNRGRPPAVSNGEAAGVARARAKAQQEVPHIPPSENPPAVQNVTRFPVIPGSSIPVPMNATSRPQQVPNTHPNTHTRPVITGSFSLSHAQQQQQQQQLQQSVSQQSSGGGKNGQLTPQGSIGSQLGPQSGSGTGSLTPLSSPTTQPGPVSINNLNLTQRQWMEMYNQLHPHEKQYLNTVHPSQRQGLVIQFIKQKQRQAKMGPAEPGINPALSPQLLSASHPQVSITPPLQHNLTVTGMRQKPLPHPGSLPNPVPTGQLQPGQLQPGQIQLNQVKLQQGQMQGAAAQFQAGQMPAKLMGQSVFLPQHLLPQGVGRPLQQTQQGMLPLQSSGNITTHSLLSANPMLQNPALSLNPNPPNLMFPGGPQGMNMSVAAQRRPTQQLYSTGMPTVSGVPPAMNAITSLPPGSLPPSLSLANNPLSNQLSNAMPSSAPGTRNIPGSVPTPAHPHGMNPAGTTVPSLSNPMPASAPIGNTQPPGSLPNTGALFAGTAMHPRAMQGSTSPTATHPQMTASLLQMRERAAGNMMGSPSDPASVPNPTVPVAGSAGMSMPILPTSAPNNSINHSGLLVNHTPSGPAVK